MGDFPRLDCYWTDSGALKLFTRNIRVSWFSEWAGSDRLRWSSLRIRGGSCCLAVPLKLAMPKADNGLYRPDTWLVSLLAMGYIICAFLRRLSRERRPILCQVDMRDAHEPEQSRWGSTVKSK